MNPEKPPTPSALSTKLPHDFLNPKSMLTPGLCGGVTMVITNVLATQFGLPPNYTGLAISALFGLIVFAATATALWLRLVFWMLNSLVIFSIALGTNQGGLNGDKLKQGAQISRNATAQLKTAFFVNWLDGTVPRRNDLMAKIKQLSERQAREALRYVGWMAADQASAKLMLEKTVASAQTGDSLTAYEAAVAKAQ